MAIHTPAQQPVHHVHIALPHLSEAATGVLQAIVAILLVLAVGIVASLVVAPGSTTTSEAQRLAQFRASERAEYVLPEAQRLAQFRLEEHGY